MEVLGEDFFRWSFLLQMPTLSSVLVLVVEVQTRQLLLEVSLVGLFFLSRSSYSCFSSVVVKDCRRDKRNVLWIS